MIKIESVQKIVKMLQKIYNSDWKIGILFSIISLFITSGIFVLFIWAAPL